MKVEEIKTSHSERYPKPEYGEGMSEELAQTFDKVRLHEINYHTAITLKALIKELEDVLNKPYHKGSVLTAITNQRIDQLKQELKTLEE